MPNHELADIGLTTMNAIEFTFRWAEVVMQHEFADGLQLVTAPSSLLNNPTFPNSAAHFLVEAGLPRSCAPFLSFEAIAQGPASLVEFYGAHQFHAADVERLAGFYILGSDSAGNPLCLDSVHNGEIIMLDHEDGFRTHTFVALSVVTLAKALLIVHTVPYKDFVEHLRPLDPRAAEKSAFLPAEVAMCIG